MIDVKCHEASTPTGTVSNMIGKRDCCRWELSLAKVAGTAMQQRNFVESFAERSVDWETCPVRRSEREHGYCERED